MKNVKWKISGGGKYTEVTIGALTLRSSVWWEKGRESWMATVMFPGQVMRIGAFCSSLAKCKEEAFKVAREMLEDHYVAIKVEMVNFGMEEEVTDGNV